MSASTYPTVYEDLKKEIMSVTDGSFDFFPLAIAKFFTERQNTLMENYHKMPKEERDAFDREGVDEITDGLARKLWRLIDMSNLRQKPVDYYDMFSGICSAKMFLEIISNDRKLFHILKPRISTAEKDFINYEKSIDELGNKVTAHDTSASALLAIHKFLYEKQHGSIIQRSQSIVHHAPVTAAPVHVVKLSDKQSALDALDAELANLPELCNATPKNVVGNTPTKSLEEVLSGPPLIDERREK